MPAFSVAVVNQSKAPNLVSDDDLNKFIYAFRLWLIRFTVYWSEVAGTTVRLVSPDQQPEMHEATLVIAPSTSQAGTFGYHYENPSGFPLGIVEMDSCVQYDMPWTVVACHEIAELLINPRVANFVHTDGKFFPKEVSDPLTSDQLEIEGVMMANAVTPAWFDPKSIKGPYDLMGNAVAPIPTIPRGGWIEWTDGVTWSNSTNGIPDNILAYRQSRDGRMAHARRTI